MAELEVRTATDRDIEAVEPLATDALGRLAALRGGTALLEDVGLAPDATASALARAVCGAGAPEMTGYVAVLDGTVVGFAAAVRRGGRLELACVHTARSLRRRRIGSELLSAVQAHARAAGLGFEALALPGDQTVKSLLEASGFRARLLRMSDDR